MTTMHAGGQLISRKKGVNLIISIMMYMIVTTIFINLLIVLPLLF